MEFSKIIKSGEAEGREKHVPTITIDKGHKEDVDIVRVVVGHEAPHPNTVEHHIAWVSLYGVKQDGQVINLGRSDLAPAYTSPNVRFQVPVDQFKAFCAVSYCNVHGVWENCLEL